MGTQSNRDAIGARVTFESSKRKYVRHVVGGGSYLSQNPYYVHFALPAGEEWIQTEIQWPSGTEQVISQLAPNSRTLIVEASAD